MKIGVCYYPEHWPESQWKADASHMVAVGIRVVRIGEFAWSRLEPTDGELNLDWLQRAIDTLTNAGLEIVLGTPTATPPKWLVNKFPDILACDHNGQTRGFGSRRHYCFSSLRYRKECARIVRILAEKFGQHPGVTAWQTDNEYGCHDTIFSYSESAKTGFRQWCEAQYSSIEELNERWGNVFWSMEYRSFDEIDLPCNSVTETSQSHRLAFWRFSTEQVKTFNRLQVDILRQYSPGRLLIHNYMGNFTDFDHYRVAEDLDVASWDNYPLGFLDRDGNSAADLERWFRTGHPDSSALHHDLYRGVGKGRWWVMEQQPGPVNWAPHNPSPLAGMVRFWGWEAFAHGAEVMSYFRWRQAPFAQEQMHSGLCLPNGKADTGAEEVEILARELSLPAFDSVDSNQEPCAPVAMIFDYAGNAMHDIVGFSGESVTGWQQFSDLYSACRRCGVNIDILPPDADLSDYAVILVSASFCATSQLLEQLKKSAASVLLFPGSGSRTADCTIPDSLAPGHFKDLINIEIDRCESLPGFALPVANTDEGDYQAQHWRERVRSQLNPRGTFEDGWGFHYVQGSTHYINATLSVDDLYRFIKCRLTEANIAVTETTVGLRYRRVGSVQFAFNFGPSEVVLKNQHFLLGQATLKAGELAAWRIGGNS
ncbi:MAG: beta-galactosidase [Gammaproteobacteria bacterium]|nr:beta-galactosidase [Gammaproteobacteria bacterium]